MAIFVLRKKMLPEDTNWIIPEVYVFLLSMKKKEKNTYSLLLKLTCNYKVLNNSDINLWDSCGVKAPLKGSHVKLNPHSISNNSGRTLGITVSLRTDTACLQTLKAVCQQDPRDLR